MPRLLLLGRDRDALAGLAQSYGIDDWTTDLDAALARPDFPVFFDAAATKQRVSALRKAVAAGKHIYSEKPVAPSLAEGRALLHAAQARGLKAGAVEDKINLPGLQKLLALSQSGYFGRVTGFRLDFGWWVFDGAERDSQRPSWNYQRSGGGGLTSDMLPHWRYVIEGILGPIRRVVSATPTAIPERVDEEGNRFHVDVDDTSVTLAELASGAVGTIICSWATRVRRDDLVTLQIEGTGGSALAGLHRCWMQSAADTPPSGASIPTPISAPTIAGNGKRLPARPPTPIRIVSAGRIFCVMSLPTHRWSAILPPVSAMYSWRKRAIAAPRNRHG